MSVRNVTTYRWLTSVVQGRAICRKIHWLSICVIPCTENSFLTDGQRILLRIHKTNTTCIINTFVHQTGCQRECYPSVMHSTAMVSELQMQYLHDHCNKRNTRQLSMVTAFIIYSMTAVFIRYSWLFKCFLSELSLMITPQIINCFIGVSQPTIK